MTLTEEFEYAYAAGEETVLCIRRVGVSRTLCGRRVSYVLASQFDDPARACEVCAAKVRETGGVEP